MNESIQTSLNDLWRPVCRQIIFHIPYTIEECCQGVLKNLLLLTMIGNAYLIGTNPIEFNPHKLPIYIEVLNQTKCRKFHFFNTDTIDHIDASFYK